MNTLVNGMNVEKFEATLEQNHRLGIKFNSHIPTKHKWYAIVNGDYLGVEEGHYAISDSQGNLITTLSNVPEYLMKHLNKK